MGVRFARAYGVRAGMRLRFFWLVGGCVEAKGVAFGDLGSASGVMKSDSESDAESTRALWDFGSSSSSSSEEEEDSPSEGWGRSVRIQTGGEPRRPAKSRNCE